MDSSLVKSIAHHPKKLNAPKPEKKKTPKEPKQAQTPKGPTSPKAKGLAATNDVTIDPDAVFKIWKLQMYTMRNPLGLRG
jgi:hypothetical protein